MATDYDPDIKAEMLAVAIDRSVRNVELLARIGKIPPFAKINRKAHAAWIAPFPPYGRKVGCMGSYRPDSGQKKSRHRC